MASPPLTHPGLLRPYPSLTPESFTGDAESFTGVAESFTGDAESFTGVVESFTGDAESFTEGAESFTGVAESMPVQEWDDIAFVSQPSR